MNESANEITPTPDTTAENGSSAPGNISKTSIIVIGVVAAAVSAVTVAYVFWSRSKRLHPQVESVQQILDRCHDQVRAIEQRLGDLTSAASTSAA